MKTLFLIVLQLGANGADAYYTNRNMHQRGFQEHDIIAQPFVRNTGTLAGSMALGALGSIASESLLRRHHHDKWADALAAGNISGHAYGAETSARHWKESR